MTLRCHRYFATSEKLGTAINEASYSQQVANTPPLTNQFYSRKTNRWSMAWIYDFFLLFFGISTSLLPIRMVRKLVLLSKDWTTIFIFTCTLNTLVLCCACVCCFFFPSLTKTFIFSCSTQVKTMVIYMKKKTTNNVPSSTYVPCPHTSHESLTDSWNRSDQRTASLLYKCYI